MIFITLLTFNYLTKVYMILALIRVFDVNQIKH